MIFVTGGTGLVGNCVIRELVSRQIPVRALCRARTPRLCFEGLDVQVVEGELSDPGVLRQATEGCSTVIHCAAMIHIGWKRLAESRRVNVEGTRNVVKACLATGANLIYVSTVDTLPAAKSIDQPISETSKGVPKTECTYVISKREAEQVVRQAMTDEQLKAKIIHPGLMLAPYDWKPSSGRMMLEVYRAPLAFAPSGGCSVCDARDVAKGIVSAIDNGRFGEAYILAGENMSYQELWSRMLKTSGKSKRVLSPRVAIESFARVLNAISAVLPFREGDINGAAIAMGQQFHFYDSSKARRELGYTTRELSETLTDAWQWLKQHHLRK